MISYREFTRAGFEVKVFERDDIAGQNSTIECYLIFAEQSLLQAETGIILNQKCPLKHRFPMPMYLLEIMCLRCLQMEWISLTRKFIRMRIQVDPAMLTEEGSIEHLNRCGSR